jgi:hypothetical protein
LWGGAQVNGQALSPRQREKAEGEGYSLVSWPNREAESKPDRVGLDKGGVVILHYHLLSLKWD